MGVGSAATVDINGYALRELRCRAGLRPGVLAARVGCHRTYITNIECGRVRRVSQELFANLLTALDIQERRVLMAAPHPADTASGAEPA